MKETAVILLPGLDGTGILFRPLLDQLLSTLRPIVVSYPGDEKLGYQALLAQVMRTLPTRGPFILLGESFSGPIAIMAAAARPPGLIGVVLCATFVRSPFWLRLPWLQHIVPDFAFRFYPVASGIKAILGGYSTQERRESFQRAIAAVAPDVLAHRVRQALQVDVSGELQRCPVPVLSIRGSRDLVVPKHNAREIATLSPEASNVTIKAPHMVLQTRPQEAAAAIGRFVESIEAMAERTSDE